MNDKIMVKRDIVIIGGGPAGLAAALAAKKEGAESILILERDKEHPFKRAALHAWRVSFQHPFKDEFISLEAPLPFDFRELVSFFGPGSI